MIRIYSPAIAALFLASCASPAMMEAPTAEAAAAIALPAAPVTVPVDGSWQVATTDPYQGKRDDIHFADARTGFYGTGAGDLFRTDDGGESWAKIWSQKGTFIRAIGFVDPQNGFLGNVGDYYPGVTDDTPLYRTRDGGRTWAAVALPAGASAVKGVCAIDILKTRAIYQGELRERTLIHAAGRVGGPAHILRSVDGGETWSVIDLAPMAGMVLDVKFVTPETGFVFAGSSGNAAESEARILKTTDGGQTWRIVYQSGRKLENSWKGSFVDANTGYATVQSYDPQREQQVIVKTSDGGETWRELPLVVNAKARQFGIGFANADVGWVGTAAGGFETRDGGQSWSPVKLAPAANKIRTRAADGTPMIYAIGTQVQFHR